MTEKKTTVKIKTTFQYVQLMNGIFGLTDTEIKVLAAFIDKQKQLKASNIDINVFCTEIKKQVAERLGRDNFNTLNNYIKRMHDKKAIRKIDSGYEIHWLLVPNNEKEVVFKIKWIDQK